MKIVMYMMKPLSGLFRGTAGQGIFKLFLLIRHRGDRLRGDNHHTWKGVKKYRIMVE